MSLNVCVVGCGDRGKQHAKAWQQRGDARVAAVCDILQDPLAALAQETGAAAYQDYHDAVLHEGIDVVSVCVPTCLHTPIPCFAAENGRHVFCEKPLALTIEEGRKTLTTIEKQGVRFMPCFQQRDRLLTKKQRELFRAGAFGGPVRMLFSDVREVRPKTAMHRLSMNGGPVIDMACHLFDVMRYITGEEAVKVHATGDIFGKAKKRLAGIDELAIDEASIEVMLNGGHKLSMYLNWGMPESFAYPFNTISMVGPELAVYAQGGNVVANYGEKQETWPDEHPGIRDRLENLVEAIRNEKAPDLTGEDAMATLRMSLASLESIRTGQIVELG